MQNIVILGATGSIGTSSLKVISVNLDKYCVYGLVANSNVESMFALAKKFKPKYIAFADESSALKLEKLLKKENINTEVLAGSENIANLCKTKAVDIVIAAIVGAAGLVPTMSAIKAGKKILLANKESLVMSGKFFIDAARKYGAQLLPIDSEHNAIFQALPKLAQESIGFCDLNLAGVSKILLTGSGGPFRYSDISSLKNVTPEQAITHPNWSMGPKISVDSATMMNKGLEYIEAKWLFNAKPKQIQVVIHPQSIIHSMVQYIDGSVIAQMGLPDMCTPIACALSYPNRVHSSVGNLDFTKIKELTFLEPDLNKYPCLKLAIDACYSGQAATTIMNAANEIFVHAFLQKQISFVEIADYNREILEKYNYIAPQNIEDLINLDKSARFYALEMLK